MKMPLCPSGQEFGPECNVVIFARKLIGGTYRVSRNKSKILYENGPRSVWSRIWTKMQCGRFCTKNFRYHIQRSKKQTENSLETKKLKKKNNRVNFLRKCPMSVQLRVLTGMQCCCFCAKTCRYHMRSKKQIKNSLETKMK